MIGFILGLWIVSFLVVFAPFDASDLSFKIRLMLMPGYGVITWLGYLVLIPFQNLVFNYKKSWKLLHEIGFLTVFNLVALVGCYLYYKTDAINGEYSLLRFTLGVYYPIFFIILPMILLSRWYVGRQVKNAQEVLILYGENKLDVLKLQPDELVAVSSASNYVEVMYLQEGQLKKKLLRTSLKNIREQMPHLVQIHRSHVINTTHFKEWKNAQTIMLTQLELPVSKNFRNEALSLSASNG